MRIQVLSDIHFEFHHDGGESFVRDVYAPNVDVLVLAGDIAVGAGIGPALTLFSERYPHVVYVHGNHEFYGWQRADVLAFTKRACNRLRNVHWLDAGSVEILGQRFLGAPLWFGRSEAATELRPLLNDFRRIVDYESWVYAENARARAFFEREVRDGDVVISHHLPTPMSVRDEFRGHPLNCFFVSDVSHVLRENKPALWIHGHTHGSIDSVVEQTRVVCNPYGYRNIEENETFEPRCVVELDERADASAL